MIGGEKRWRPPADVIVTVLTKGIHNTNAINVIFFPSGWFILQMHDTVHNQIYKTGFKGNFAYCFCIFHRVFYRSFPTEKTV